MASENDTTTDATATDAAATAAAAGAEDQTAATAETQQGNDIPPEVKKALQKANKEAETLRLKLKEFEDRDKTDSQKQLEELETLRTEAATLRLENLRRDVASEKGLTHSQARRLIGSTREELEADADDFLQSIPKPGFGDVGQGHRGQAPTGPAQQFADLIRARRG